MTAKKAEGEWPFNCLEFYSPYLLKSMSYRGFFLLKKSTKIRCTRYRLPQLTSNPVTSNLKMEARLLSKKNATFFELHQPAKVVTIFCN